MIDLVPTILALNQDATIQMHAIIRIHLDTMQVPMVVLLEVVVILRMSIHHGSIEIYLHMVMLIILAMLAYLGELFICELLRKKIKVLLFLFEDLTIGTVIFHLVIRTMMDRHLQVRWYRQILIAITIRTRNIIQVDQENLNILALQVFLLRLPHNHGMSLINGQ